jgi:hypothetical protein
MKTKVALFYIGLVRFEKLGKENHKKLIDILTEAYDLKIYDFTLPNIDRTDCTFEDSGRIQVYDFYTALDQIEEDIVIKFRTDIWFTNSSIEMLLDAIDNVVNDTLDVVYLGYDFRNYYSEKGFKIDADAIKKVADFVVVSNKQGLTTRAVALQKCIDDRSKNGNVLFKNIRSDTARSVMISCHMYLVRKEFLSFSHYDILHDWVQQYRITGDEMNWVLDHKDLINKEY